MAERIVPRSPREKMCGWVHLPRFIDKIRLRLQGRLHPDYQANFAKGFDGRWLEAAGLTADVFIEVVRNSPTDGEVCNWVFKHVQCSDAERDRFNAYVLNRGRDDDEVKGRLEQRKKECGFAGRNDIQTFLDLIEADEGRM